MYVPVHARNLRPILREMSYLRGQYAYRQGWRQFSKPSWGYRYRLCCNLGSRRQLICIIWPHVNEILLTCFYRDQNLGTFPWNARESPARVQQDIPALRHVEGGSSFLDAVVQPSFCEDHIAANGDLYAGGNGGCKRRRINEDRSANTSESSDLMPCPFSVISGDMALCDPRTRRKRKDWREHILRAHKPVFYDHCPVCGDLFKTRSDWIAHTRPQCQGHLEGREQKPTHQRVTEVQASEIKSRSQKGRKIKLSNEDLLREYIAIIFPDDLPTISPHPSHASNHPHPDWLGSDREIQERASRVPGMETIPIKDRVPLIRGIYQEFSPGLLRPKANENDDGAVHISDVGHSENSTSHLTQNIASLSRQQAPDTPFPHQHNPAPVDDQLVGSTSASHVHVRQRDACQEASPPIDGTYRQPIDPALIINNLSPQLRYLLSICSAQSTDQSINPVRADYQTGIQLEPRDVFDANPEDNDPFCGAPDTESHSPFYGFGEQG